MAVLDIFCSETSSLEGLAYKTHKKPGLGGEKLKRQGKCGRFERRKSGGLFCGAGVES